MNKCFNIKGCPASFYLMCEAYRQSKNCFEVKNPACCHNHTLQECKKCPFYLKIQNWEER
ncbi:MAG: hypothetical protein AB1422_14665 [bacterium]